MVSKSTPLLTLCFALLSLPLACAQITVLPMAFIGPQGPGDTPSFTRTTPSVIHVDRNTDLSDIPKVKKEKAGNEDSCPLCKVLNGIYKIGPHEELKFPFEVVKPSTVRIRVYASGTQPEKVIAELRRDGQAEPFWSPISRMVEPETSTINGSKEIGEAQISRGTHWRVVIRNTGTRSVSMGVIISIIGMAK